MLAAGNLINQMHSYSSESVELFRGYQYSTMVGLAIVDPSQPSRSIPFIIPSRQKGRPDRPMSIRRPVYIHRVALRVPKDIVWTNVSTYSINGTLNGQNHLTDVSVDTTVLAPGSSPATFMNVLIDPNRYPHRNDFDTEQIMQVFPGSKLVELVMKYKTSLNPSLEAQAVIPYGEVMPDANSLPTCPSLLLDDSTAAQEGQFGPYSENFSLNFKNTAAAPVTLSGKKSAFILELSLFQPFYETIGTEKAFQGLDF
jgi:hypothetical protein